MSKSIQCARCGKNTIYGPENQFRPFCSERCQMIDFGTWADEGYKVPDTSQSPLGTEDTESEAIDPYSFPEDR